MKEKCPLCGNDKEATGMQLLCHPPITEMACRKCQPDKFRLITFNVKKHDEAALKQSVWDGTGAPPVGVECEWQDKNTKKWVEVLVVYASEWVTVIRENKTVDPVELAIENYGDEARRQFRPIRSERDKIGEEIYRVINWNHYGDIKRDSRFDDYCRVYDAIVAGKIPSVKLSD